jgi:glycosyltransferase involved in cell wall biosynthesis
MVIDPWHHPFNGTVVSTRRFVKALRNKFDFRILRTAEQDLPIEQYATEFPRLRIPGINRILDSMKAPLAIPYTDNLRSIIANCDLVHIQFPFFLGHAAITEAERQKKPIVASFHVQPENILSNLNLNFIWLTRLLYKLFIWRFYNRADLVIAPSKFAADLLLSAGLKKSVIVLSNGVPEEFFLPRKAIINDEYFNILSVGRLAKEKQQHRLLEAVANSKFKSRIKVTMVGTGPEQEKLRELADTLKIEASIGRVSNTELKKLYTSADIFVQTSAVELEGMSVLEAMAAGCPVLIHDSDTSAVPEFVTAAPAKFAMNNTEDLGNKIDVWLSNKNFREKASIENTQIARTRHHDSSLEQLEQIYSRILKQFNSTEYF